MAFELKNQMEHGKFMLTEELPPQNLCFGRLVTGIRVPISDACRAFEFAVTHSNFAKAFTQASTSIRNLVQLQPLEVWRNAALEVPFA